MNALVGARARVTQHDTDGVAYSAEGEIVALAAVPGPPMNPHDPKPWDCLIRIDGTASVLPYNVVELEILDEDLLPPEAEATVELDAIRARLVELDDENAALTAANAALQKQIATLTAAAAPKKGGKS